MAEWPAASEGFRSGFVAIVGRPNVGKSTLMNALVGQKIAITSPVAQTTRNRLRGILTSETAQMIFVDTPGIHKPQHQLGRILVKNAQAATRGVDLILMVVDASVEAGGGDRYIVQLLKDTTTPVILGLNKIDENPTPDIPATYSQIIPDSWLTVEFSALTGTGLDKLQKILCDRLPIGPCYYPPDLVTDQPERFIMAELIREQIILKTREEIPYAVAVVVEKVAEEPNITRVTAAIQVERNSQKGILIGRGGAMLKAIGTAAREEIQTLVDGKVYLELFVKVQPQWRQSNHELAELGYRVEES